ncbi:PilW family protein [Pseudomonas sp. N040]|uniref:PilW family protein n=1 Tax=Pseudomonas sp. N040 TaxID=2785325 RepID=UPI0018A2AEE8|nr:PilW family protein [Pseudomonas sp. N040]MBF7730242.1 PilW family protein [Pseudomonas sp. N040]MBW7013884.1 PilW family protein [Pseudomonas sp. N040]
MNPIKFRRRQAGLSLIELMVAMAVALLMTVAILQLFLDIVRSNDDLARTNAQIENGRFAIQLISNDLMHAGFWDGYLPDYDDLTAADAPTGYPASFVAPDPCLALASWTATYKDNLLRMPVQSFNAVPAGCSGVVQNRKAGTDVLVVRYAGTSVVASPAAGSVYFQPSFCSGASAYAYVLGTSGFSMQKRDCLTTADIRAYVSHIYFIRTDNTLMRAEFVGGVWSVQPLIDGVESLVVELGVDDVSDSGGAVDYSAAVAWADPLDKVSPTNRGDGAPDGGFVRCPAAGCTVDQLLNTVAAKLYLLVRATEATPDFTNSKSYTLGSTAVAAFNDGFKRHVYSTSVRFHNVAARRETP